MTLQQSDKAICPDCGEQSVVPQWYQDGGSLTCECCDWSGGWV